MGYGSANMWVNSAESGIGFHSHFSSLSLLS